MGAIVASLVPVFALIVLGHGLARGRFGGSGFWPGLERLVYYLLYPALLVHDLARADLGGLNLAALFATCLLAIFAMVPVALLGAKALRLDGPGFTSLFQGATRCNGFVALAAASALGGAAGLSTMALVITCMVPAVNFLSVVLLARFGKTRAGVGATFRGILSNPLILGCVAGVALNLLGHGLHPLAAETLRILGAAALPLGLLAVGAGLDFAKARSAGFATFVGAAAKCLLFPALVVAIAAATGLDGAARTNLILFAAMPTAPSAYILARQLGGDAPLVGAITTLSTLFAVASLPLVIAWAG